MTAASMTRLLQENGLGSERAAEKEDSVSQSVVEKPQNRISHLGK